MAELAPIDFFSDIREWLRKVSTAVNAALTGTNKTVAAVTLTADQATTTVLSPYVTESSHITFTPTTANAAAEIGAGGMYVSARTNATSFVITHANNTQPNRTFTYEIERP